MIIRKRRYFIVLFLLALGLLAAALLPRTGAAKEQRGADGMRDFVLLLSQVDEVYAPCLHVGDRIVDRQSRRILGSVQKIETRDAVTEIFSEAQGRLIEAAVPGRLDILLTVSPYTEQQPRTAAKGNAVRIGQIYYFRTYDYLGEGQVIALR